MVYKANFNKFQKLVTTCITFSDHSVIVRN